MTHPHDLPLPRRSFLGVAAVGVLGLTVAGCGGGDSSSSDTTADTGATSGEGAAKDSTATAPTKGTTLPIAMKDIQFVPKVAVARVGQKVTWTNADDVQHDVRALKGAKFQSPLFGKGGSYSFTPKQAGTIEYDCSVHPGMTGVLKVVE